MFGKGRIHEAGPWACICVMRELKIGGRRIYVIVRTDISEGLSVVQVVFRRGKHLTLEAQEDPAAVPLILEHWVDAQLAAREATHLKHALEDLLRPRLGNDADASPV